MKVIINNEKKFRKKNGYNKKSNFDKYYLLLVNNRFKYVDVSSVFVVDENITDDWIYRKFKKGYKIEYDSGIFGEYGYISVKSYIGPEIFINDKSFLINIVYEPGAANRFFYENYIKKNEK